MFAAQIRGWDGLIQRVGECENLLTLCSEFLGISPERELVPPFTKRANRGPPFSIL
jgi:hypothetical protein